jgi:hypothetical protein
LIKIEEAKKDLSNIINEIYIFIKFSAIKKPTSLRHRSKFKDGAPKGIRTPALSVRSRTLYPAELLAHAS